MPRKGPRTDVTKLKPGDVVNNLTVLAVLPEFNEVLVRCSKCHLKAMVPLKNFYSREACGCTARTIKDPYAPTSPERVSLDAMNDRIDKERSRYIPKNLREFWRFRQIDPRWERSNPDRYRNFIEDVGHRKPRQVWALLDPCGDFTPENFYWRDDTKDHPRPNQGSS